MRKILRSKIIGYNSREEPSKKFVRYYFKENSVKQKLNSAIIKSIVPANYTVQKESKSISSQERLNQIMSKKVDCRMTKVSMIKHIYRMMYHDPLLLQ